jgi:hypothetical protein
MIGFPPRILGSAVIRFKRFFAFMRCLLGAALCRIGTENTRRQNHLPATI